MNLINDWMIKYICEDVTKASLIIDWIKNENSRVSVSEITVNRCISATEITIIGKYAEDFDRINFIMKTIEGTSNE